MTISTKIKAYLALIRPIGWAPFLFPLLFGLIDSGFSSLILVYGILVIVGPLLGGGVYTLNFYSDVEADRQSTIIKDLKMSVQPFVTRSVGNVEGLLLAGILLLIGLVSSWLISIEVFVTAAIMVAIGVIYSVPPRLKDIPFGDILANSTVAAMCYIVGWITFRNIGEITVFPVLWIFFLVAATYVLTVIIDIEADKQAGLNTTATYLGMNKAVTLGFFLYLLSLVFFILTLTNTLSFHYLIISPGLLKGLHSYYKRLKSKDLNSVYKLAKTATAVAMIVVIILLVLYTAFNVFGIDYQEILTFYSA